jgi:hypothetical protein
MAWCQVICVSYTTTLGILARYLASRSWASARSHATAFIRLASYELYIIRWKVYPKPPEKPEKHVHLLAAFVIRRE